MQTLQMERDYIKEVGKLVGQFAAPSHADVTLDTDSRVVAPDGDIIAVLLCQVVRSDLHKRAFELLKVVKDRPSHRASAMGTRSLPKSINLDGSPSPRTGVNKRVVDVSGAYEGRLGWDRSDHETKLTIENRELLFGNQSLIKQMDRLYREHLPLAYAQQARAIGRFPQCRLLETVFTSIYVGRNFRTAYHRDANNLAGARTCLFPTGNFAGGELVLPRFRIAFAFRPGDVLFFDPDQVHGNLPFTGERISMALYCGGWVAK